MSDYKEPVIFENVTTVSDIVRGLSSEIYDSLKTNVEANFSEEEMLKVEANDIPFLTTEQAYLAAIYNYDACIQTLIEPVMEQVVNGMSDDLEDYFGDFEQVDSEYLN